MAWCCETFNGIENGCDSYVGGIQKVFIACTNSVTSKTVTDGMISAISATAGAFKEFNFNAETGSVSGDFTADNAAGARYWEYEIVLQFGKRETVKRLEIAALAASDVEIIVQDNNGLYWYYGYIRPARMSAGTDETGTAFADFSGYNITFTGVEVEPAYEVSQSAMNSIIGGE